MSYVLLFLPRCLALKKCFDFKKSSSSLHSTSQYDTNMPVTEIEEQTCISHQELNQIHTNQTNQLSHSNRRINFADSPETKSELDDCKIRLNTSAASSPVSSCKLTPKLNSSSVTEHLTSSTLLSKGPAATTTSDSGKQINLRFNEEDLLNNNERTASKSTLNQVDACADGAAEKRPKIEMKIFRKLAKGTSYESECSLASDQVAQLQTHKNGKKIPMIRHSTKNLQRSVSEKSNQDNTAKQVVNDHNSIIIE